MINAKSDHLNNSCLLLEAKLIDKELKIIQLQQEINVLEKQIINNEAEARKRGLHLSYGEKEYPSWLQMNQGGE
jgi:hypothetical protein